MGELPGRAAEGNPLETEILQEKAQTLLRISRTLSGILDELSVTQQAVPDLEGRERSQAVARFNELRERAKLYFWYLMVQRESMGLRHHVGLEEFYPIPRAM
jgi:hypothetical protein